MVSTNSSIELAFIPHTLDLRDAKNPKSLTFKSDKLYHPTTPHPRRVKNLWIPSARVGARAVLLHYYFEV